MARTADRRSHARLAAVTLLVSLACSGLVGCDDEGPSNVDNTTALRTCGSMFDVVQRFGPTLAGPYDPVALGRYTFVFVETDLETQLAGGPTQRLAVLTPDDTLCQAEIAGQLEDACGYCRDASVENCLLEVEAAFRTPSENCVVCGDGRCASTETSDACPQDCRCGDGSCDVLLGETSTSCPADCPNACGNGLCERGAGEACVCTEDAPGCQPCAVDCCSVVCGDGVCDAPGGEDRDSCEEDCGAGYCGDDRCLAGETPESCPRDCPEPSCTSCPTCYKDDFGGSPVICGDGLCVGCEPRTCTPDCIGVDIGFCGASADAPMSCPARYCGDNRCEGLENSIVCPIDCPAGTFGQAPVCGDGLCQPGELAVPDRTPREDDVDDVCAEDCGGVTCEHVDVQSACGDPSRPTRRCAYLATNTGLLGQPRYEQAIVNCDLACPVEIVCFDGCDESTGEPRCVSCSSGASSANEPCDAVGDKKCDEDGNVFTCTQFSTNDLPGCLQYQFLTRCSRGCDEMGECL